MATKESQRARVLEWLQTRGELTVRQAVTEMGIMSLPKRIEELRKAGNEIATCFRKSANGSRYGVYMLVELED